MVAVIRVEQFFSDTKPTKTSTKDDNLTTQLIMSKTKKFWIMAVKKLFSGLYKVWL